MAERVIADHKVTCSNQVTSFKKTDCLFIFVISMISRLNQKKIWPLLLLLLIEYQTSQRRQKPCFCKYVNPNANHYVGSKYPSMCPRIYQCLHLEIDKTIWKDSEELSSLDSGGNFGWLNYGDSTTTQGDDTSPYLVG